jgi:hypothetical protein
MKDRADGIMEATTGDAVAAARPLKEEVLSRAVDIRAVVERNLASHPRLFGSVVRGEESADSDIDVLMDAAPGCSMLDLVRIENALMDMFGREVDISTIGDLHPSMRPQVLEQAIAL